MTKLKVGLAAAGLMIVSTIAFAGLWPGFPIVGIGALCWGSASTTSSVTACPNTSPAGPTVVTGSELIPADVYNTTTGAPGRPATVLLSLASLGAMPVTNINVTSASPLLSATNLMGGVVFRSAATITAANVTLPPLPIDGQRFTVSTNRTITTLLITGANVTSVMGTNVSPVTISQANPLAPSGFTYIFNAADISWYRLN